jgi:hypothetical protein
MLRFTVHGPFEVPITKGKNGRYIPNDCPEFWNVHPTCKAEAGVYVFAKRAAKGIKPIYVGKTVRTFAVEAFHSLKISKHYAPALADSLKGTFVMFFLVPERRPGKLNETMIGELEVFMIQTAFAKNPNLSNVKEANLPDWGVEGVIRGKPRRPNASESSFKGMMGLNKY